MHSTVVLHNRFLVVLGGVSLFNLKAFPLWSVEVIDTVSGTRVDGPNMTLPRSLFGAVVVNQSHLVVVGGKNGKASNDSESIQLNKTRMAISQQWQQQAQHPMCLKKELRLYFNQPCSYKHQDVGIQPLLSAMDCS